MKIIRGSALVSFLLAAAFLPIGSAYADHGGMFPEGNLNTVSWKVCRAGTTAGVNSTDGALGLIDAAVVNPTIVSCSSGNQNVNVWATSDPTVTYFGITECSGIYNSTNNKCSSMTVKLISDTITTAPDPVKQWQKTACHELGHVGGLGHRPTTVITSCLVQGDSPPIYTIYDTHDINSLNDTYS